MLHLASEHYVFAGEHANHIADKQGVEHTGGGTGCDNPVKIYEHHFSPCRRDNGHGQNSQATADYSLGKHPALSHFRNYVSVAPSIVFDKAKPSAAHNANLSDKITR
jgi:hypothetical protein